MKDEEAYFARLRQTMVIQQIASRGVSDPRVLDAMREVPRHMFVPREFEPEACNDYPLPVGKGQTISQPYIVAHMTELLELKGRERVLEIGTGSGYQTAILSLLCAEVFTVEYIDELARAATERLDRLGYRNVHVRVGDGYQGWPDAAPFEGIMVTAATPLVPEPLTAQLAAHGRLVVPVGPEFGDQTLMLYRRQGQELAAVSVEPVRFVPLRGAVERQSVASENRLPQRTQRTTEDTE
jgi:protein-L-isoaspartate(D-aspartate) O-methyltransferase